MATSTSILQKVQQAVRNYLRDESRRPSWITEAQIVSGISRGYALAPTEDTGQDVSVDLPRIICECRMADISVQGANNWRAVITVRLEESSDDTDEDTHLAHQGQVFDLLMTDTIAADLSTTLSDFHVLGYVITSQAVDLAGRRWTASFNCEAEVTGYDLG